MKYYCITLAETPERTEHAKAQAAKAGIELDFIYGIFGKTMQVKSEIPMHTDYYVTRGATCLVLSWHIAWQIAWREGHEEFVIFEDDFILPDNFNERWKILRQEVPEWCDLVYMNSCCTDGKPTQQVHRELYEIKYPLCTAAIWHRRRAIPTLQQYTKPANTPVDILLEWYALPHLRVLTVVPELVSQATQIRDYGMPSTIHM
jgi:GR25 family glycosyltransferase involved in LPS biosynthesis